MNLSTDVKIMAIEDLKPYEKNAKIHSYNVDLIANSIKEFGFKQPILIDKKNVIIAGHGRLLAAKQLDLVEVPCIIADDLTPTQVKALRLADNKVAESSYDTAVLDDELQSLLDEQYDMSDFGFDLAGEIEPPEKDPYTAKIDIPQYQMTGAEPELTDLASIKRYEELTAEIDESECPEDVKEFMKLAATRHIKFDYAKIAEYYAHADAATQRLMEKSALVIIDFDDAIKNGYVKLTSALDDVLIASDKYEP